MKVKREKFHMKYPYIEPIISFFVGIALTKCVDLFFQDSINNSTHLWYQSISLYISVFIALSFTAYCIFFSSFVKKTITSTDEQITSIKQALTDRLVSEIRDPNMKIEDDLIMAKITVEFLTSKQNASERQNANRGQYVRIS